MRVLSQRGAMSFRGNQIIRSFHGEVGKAGFRRKYVKRHRHSLVQVESQRYVCVACMKSVQR